ncbi:transposase [Rhodococcus koreensis]
MLPNATRVVDDFHLVKFADHTVTKVRRRVTWSSRTVAVGNRISRATRRRLPIAREQLSDKHFAKMWNAILADDPTVQIPSGYLAKEELRTLLATVRRWRPDPASAGTFLTWRIDSSTCTSGLPARRRSGRRTVSNRGRSATVCGCGPRRPADCVRCVQLPAECSTWRPDVLGPAPAE